MISFIKSFFHPKRKKFDVQQFRSELESRKPNWEKCDKDQMGRIIEGLQKTCSEQNEKEAAFYAHCVFSYLILEQTGDLQKAKLYLMSALNIVRQQSLDDHEYSARIINYDHKLNLSTE